MFEKIAKLEYQQRCGETGIYHTPQDNQWRLFETIYLMTQLPATLLWISPIHPEGSKAPVCVSFLFLSKWKEEEIERACL